MFEDGEIMDSILYADEMTVKILSDGSRYGKEEVYRKMWVMVA